MVNLSCLPLILRLLLPGLTLLFLSTLTGQTGPEAGVIIGVVIDTQNCTPIPQVGVILTSESGKSVSRTHREERF